MIRTLSFWDDVYMDYLTVSQLYPITILTFMNSVEYLDEHFEVGLLSQSDIDCEEYLSSIKKSFR